MWVKYQNQPTICFQCKLYGHIANDCTTDLETKNTKNIATEDIENYEQTMMYEETTNVIASHLVTPQLEVRIY